MVLTTSKCCLCWYRLAKVLLCCSRWLADGDKKAEVQVVTVQETSFDSPREEVPQEAGYSREQNTVTKSAKDDLDGSQRSPLVEPGSRRRSSGGLQRQSSICINDSDENLDRIILESNLLAEMASIERGCEPIFQNVSQNSSLDVDQEPTRICVEVHRGHIEETSKKILLTASQSQQFALEGDQQGACSPEDKQGCVSSRSMDLEDYHYSKMHGASNVANWLLGNGKKSVSSYDVKSSDIAQWREIPQRTVSIDSSDLEEIMETRRKTNSFSSTSQALGTEQSITWSDEEELKSKVRYNDTGSKEEVNEDVLDVFVEDVDLMAMDESGAVALKRSASVRSSDKISSQYRELWQLRATLEDEDLSDVTCFEDDQCDSVKKAAHDKSLGGPAIAAKSSNSSLCSQSSPCDPDGSSKCPSVEMETSAQPNIRSSRQNRCRSILLEPPTCDSRRQNYKSILNKRMQNNDSSGGQTTSLDSVGAPSTENSFDSMEMADTEGSMTDASRPEAISTSFESTTDNTDSPGENQTQNRLQQMKADSGYKSIENQSFAKKAPRLGKKKLHFVIDDMSIENVPPVQTHSASLDEGVDIFESKEEESSVKEQTVCSTSNVLSDVKILDNRLKKDRARKGSQISLGSLERKDSKSASKKRREYIKERQSSLGCLYLGDSSCKAVESAGFETDSRSDQQSGADSFDEAKKLPPMCNNPKSSIFLRFFRSSHKSSRSRIQFRDYSIDEKSDSLFREFSRHDPSYETTKDCLIRSRSPRLHPGSRRFQHRCRQMKHESGSPRSGRRKMSPQDSIEEETSHAESEELEGCDFSIGPPARHKNSEESLLEQAPPVVEQSQ